MNTKEIVNLIHGLQHLGLSGDDICAFIEYVESSDYQVLARINTNRNAVNTSAAAANTAPGGTAVNTAAPSSGGTTP